MHQLPDYLVGIRNGKTWDYKTILERLLYTLKIYDCYPLLSNNTIPLAFKSIDEVKLLANKLIELGYKDSDDLVNASKHKYPPIAVIVKPEEKEFTDGHSITIMACMCSSQKRKPLYINEFLHNIDKIIINHDFVYHNLLLLEITKMKNRPSGEILSLEEAKKRKGNNRLKELIDIVTMSKK